MRNQSVVLMIRLPVNGQAVETNVEVEQLHWPKRETDAVLLTPNRIAVFLREMRLVSGLVVAVIVQAERQRWLLRVRIVGRSINGRIVAWRDYMIASLVVVETIVHREQKS